MSQTTIRRRELLKLSAVTAVSVALEACVATPTPTPKPVPTKAAATPVPPTQPVATAGPTKPAATAAPTQPPAPTYKEAPMLADLVKAGKLPAVDKRLPSDPRVITPVEKVGKYGGTWRRAYKGVSDRWGPTKLMEEAMVQWDWTDQGIKVAPNLCSKWEQNANATEFTFTLRKGIKWSDGEEFNTDDIKFWYEDVFLNKTLVPSFPTWLRDPDLTPMKVEIVDKYVFKIRYGKPQPLLPISCAKSTGTHPVGPSFALPEHYMRKYHEKYGDKAFIDKLVKDLKLATWDQLWYGGSKGDFQGPIAFWFLNPDLPVITAWKIKVPPPAEHCVMERNPYFWKVDTAGNQLPYVDQITHDFFSDQQVFNMWVVGGKIDLQNRHVSTGDYTLLKESEKKGNYRVLRWLAASTRAYYPNINCPDAVLAKLFDTPKFRQAMSIAFNRKELAELIYTGLAEPRQASPVTGSPNYDAEFEKRWAEYDPATANKLLDELGLAKQADGTRKRPDGKTLEVVIETSDTPGSQGVDECQQIAKYWTAIGIKATVKVVERSLYTEHYQNGDIEVGVWGCDRNSIVMADPGRYLGTTQDGPWAPLYAAWYGKFTTKKVEPPADHPIKKIWSLWDQCQVEPDETKRNALFKQLLDIHKEQPWMLGTCGESASLWVVANSFRNVPDGRINDDTLRDYGLAKPCQFFFDV